MNTFGERLTLLRTGANLSQRALSEKLELASSSISMYEQGLRRPDLKTLVRIADYFDVSTDYLLGRRDHPSRQSAGLGDLQRLLQNIEEQLTREQMMWAGAPLSLLQMRMLQPPLSATRQVLDLIRETLDEPTAH